VLYLAASIFALVTAFVGGSSDFRVWGALATGGYLVAAVVSEAALELRSRRQRRIPGTAVEQASSAAAGTAVEQGEAARGCGRSGALGWWVVIFVILTTVVVPLGLEVVWRAEAHPGANAQPEVSVIERAGDRVIHHKSAYLAHPTSVGVGPSSDARDVDASSFFPYLPGMIPFGIVNAISGPPELTDARVPLSGFTFLVSALALCLVLAPLDRRRLALQVLIALPTGALPIVTGGDDLPVLALMLLALVLAQRRQPVLAGVAAGLSATLKFTAWPVVVLLVLAVRDRQDRGAAIRYGLAAAIVAVPVLGIGIVGNASAFVLNVIRFPLGLTRIHSPADSPLPGEILVHLFPGLTKELTALLVVVGVAVVGYCLWRFPPRTPAAVARFAGLSLLLALLLAPATRFGYLIYPANLMAWSYLLAAPLWRPLAPRTQLGREEAGAELDIDRAIDLVSVTRRDHGTTDEPGVAVLSGDQSGLGTS
jgi:hypothetical protein